MRFPFETNTEEQGADSVIVVVGGCNYGLPTASFICADVAIEVIHEFANQVGSQEKQNESEFLIFPASFTADCEPAAPDAQTALDTPCPAFRALPQK